MRCVLSRWRGPSVGARCATIAVLPLLAGLGDGTHPLARPPSRDSGRQPTFTANVNYVELGVRVTDAQGRFVRTLTRDDVEVMEDGKQQQVSTFELIDLPYQVRPAEAPLPLEPEPDVRSNDPASGARVFAIVLDDLHTHQVRSGQVRHAARQFLARYVGPDDLVSIVQTSGRTDANQEFTSRSGLLLDAVDKFMGRKLPSATLARREEYERQRYRETHADGRLQHVADPLDAERGRNAEAALVTLERLGRLLGEARERGKAIVLISEGIDYDLQNRSAQTRTGLSTFTSASSISVAARLEEAIGALTRANVAVYAVDPRGLAIAGEDVVELAAPPENPALDVGPLALQDEVRRGQESLRVLSEETGGIAAVTSNDLSQTFDRIMRENSTYYLLAYESDDDRYDGRFRPIQVRVRIPGARVQARRGYMATEPRGAAGGLSYTAAAVEPSEILQRALNSPLPVSQLPLRAFAAPFKGPRQNASVLFALELDARGFRFDRKDGMYTDHLEAAVVALDQRSRFLKGDRHSIDLRLKPETYEAVRRHGVRLLFRVEVEPGRYQLRAAASESGSGLAGSVHYDVDVPDFAHEALSASGIVLTSTHASKIPTARRDPDLEMLLQTPPTSERDFTRDETLSAAFAVYHDARKPVGTVDITTTITNAEGQVRFIDRAQASEEELRSAPDGYGYVKRVPLAEMAPGAYVLRVQLSSRLVLPLRPARELPFRIHHRQHR